MPGIHHITAPMTEAERNRRVYGGDILVFRGFAAVWALLEALRAHCREHLGQDPTRAHRHCAAVQLAAAEDSLRRAVRGDPAVSACLARALEEVGVDAETTYRDALTPRVQVPGDSVAGSRTAPLGVHRDTWGSNLMAQTNWWAPLWPTTPECTVALFPSWFRRPVPHNSAGWDFAELRRRLGEQGPDTDYPLLPAAREAPPADDALPISLVPGDLMAFSGAHLHASVPNGTDRIRLSVETRTVSGTDVAAGRGAPNVDGAPVRTTRQLVRRLTDHRRLGELI